MLISSVQQSDSVIHIYIIFHILSHCSLSQDTEYSSLFCTLDSCCLFILHILVSICWSQTPNPPLCPPTLATTSLLSVSLFLFHRYVHLCCILDSTGKWYHTVFVFLFWHTSFSMIIFRSIHVAENDIISLFLFSYHCVICQYHIHSRLF